MLNNLVRIDLIGFVGFDGCYRRESGGPSQTWTGDQSIMSEDLAQSSRAINIETLPRITPKSTSKITSPDYPHDFTDVDDGNCWLWLVRRRRRGNGVKFRWKDRISTGKRQEKSL